ncbi:MAG: phosphoribosyltransferase [Candidatus Anstonellales archaeon]
MRYIKYSWEEIEKLTEKLAEKIKKSGFRPDYLVGILRGGLVPARLLSDFLDDTKISFIGVEFYKGIAETKDSPTITQPIPIDVKGKTILLVDEIADTGKTIMVAINHLKEKGAKEVKIAVIDYRFTSKFKPDFYARKIKGKAWVIYPWMKKETERLLKKKVEEL